MALARALPGFVDAASGAELRKTLGALHPAGLAALDATAADKPPPPPRNPLSPATPRVSLG